jgi:4-methylaminobutanoate oxidase (formaldehyde-forming)
VRTDAAVVVVGGGVVGCSIAYHLTAAGCRDVVVLEKGELTGGATFHSAGLVSRFRTSAADVRLMGQSVRLYRELGAEVGEAAGWRPVGSLRLASSEAMLRALQRSVSRARALGLEAAVLTPAEALRLCPLMSGDGLRGAVHVPDDGYLEPNSITRELARRARAGGAEIATGTRVTSIRLDARGRVRCVETTAGPIRTDCVVNAAGQWAPRVAAMAGLDLPIVAMMHQYLVTRPVPGREVPRHMPVVRDPDNLVYVREEVGGYLVGGFEPHPKVWRLDDVPWEFTQQLLPAEWERFEPLLAGAARRFPVLEKAEVLRLVNGPEGFTPDGHYALGPVPGRPGFWVAAGMSINGVAGAGGVGRVMAEWILEGEPSIDVSELNVRRFGAHLRDRRHVAEKAREVYRYYYALRFPADEGEWGRPGRLSPLAERLLALGAVFGERGGWERANYFVPGRPGRRQGADERTWDRPSYWQHVAREHRAVRERVGVLDMTSFGKVDVTGPGALRFLQRLCANDVDRPVGSLVHTQCLNRRGGIECDVTVTRLGDSVFRVTTGTGSAASDLGWLRLHRPDDGSVDLADVTELHAVVSVWGPAARRTLARVTSADLSAAALPYLASRVIDVAGVPVRANRVSFAGELGYELVAPRDAAGRVWDAVMAGGREFGVEPVGYYALNTLRLEKCFCYWGDDIGPADTPLEANLAAFVCFGKGDFVGRDALLRQRAAGPGRTLVPLVLDGDACVLWGGEAIHLDGRVVGRVRSAGYGHTLGTNIALAYLPGDLARPGTAVSLESFGRLVPAEVRPAPLWDPRGDRVRA